MALSLHPTVSITLQALHWFNASLRTLVDTR